MFTVKKVRRFPREDISKKEKDRKTRNRDFTHTISCNLYVMNGLYHQGSVIKLFTSIDKETE